MRRRDGFTLIEMLTVIVIIVIVMSIGIPAFNNLMKSGGLSGASREVANSLGLARQYAITHRTVTRVVFPYGGTGTNMNIAPMYQSYAVIDVGSGNYISKWEHLPLGTVFMDSGSTVDASVGNPPSVDALGPPAPLPFPYTNSATYALAYIEFQPTGAATKSGTLTITEGFMNSGTMVGTVTPTSKTVTNGNTVLANQSVISVDNIVGRIKVTRP